MKENFSQKNKIKVKKLKQKCLISKFGKISLFKILNKNLNKRLNKIFQIIKQKLRKKNKQLKFFYNYFNSYYFSYKQIFIFNF